MEGLNPSHILLQMNNFHCFKPLMSLRLLVLVTMISILPVEKESTNGVSVEEAAKLVPVSVDL